MSHTALYRKKRPMNFLEVVGQEHILRALSNQIKAGQLSHAYLFCGTRGTGKTSIARIFARAINCEAPADGNPCNTCETCTGILQERNLNVVEIDAASNNGVENIRDLREDVKYQPTQGKYKIYIIDEVHMLSSSAFNALLKTLEEPPAYVIFILATTDQQKLPATILSRCQRYDFRRISPPDMADTLKKYLSQEDVEFEDEAIDYIVYHSDGAMRDALSLLDQSLSFGANKLTYAQVLDMLGAVDRGRLFELTGALNELNSGKVMEIIETAMSAGRDASQFVADLIRHFRDVLVAGLTNQTDERLKAQAKAVPPDKLMEYIHTFSETLREMRFAPHGRTALEVCALKLCVPKVVHTPVQETPVQVVAPPPQIKESPAPVVKTTVAGDLFDQICHAWDDISGTFPASWRMYCLRAGMENNQGRLEIITDNKACENTLKRHEDEIRQEIGRKFQLETPPNLAFVVREGYNKPIDVSKTVSKEAEPTREAEQQALPAEWGGEVLTVELIEPDETNDWDAVGDEVRIFAQAPPCKNSEDDEIF